MKRRITLIPVLALLMLVAVAPAMSIVYATKSVTVSGTYSAKPPPTVLDSREAGESDNVFMDVSIRLEWKGDIKGTCINVMHQIIHNYGAPEFWTLIHGVMTFDNAEVFGRKGTLIIKYCNTETAQGSELEGVWRIIGGTGELANLHGEGTIWRTPSVKFGYTGQVHFDP